MKKFNIGDAVDTSINIFWDNDLKDSANPLFDNRRHHEAGEVVGYVGPRETVIKVQHKSDQKVAIYHFEELGS